MSEIELTLTQNNPNDRLARLVEWLVEDGAQVKSDDEVAVFENSKAAWSVYAPSDGWLFHLKRQDDNVEVGSAFAILSDSSDRPDRAVADESQSSEAELVVTDHARALMERHGIAAADLPSDVGLVRAADIEALIGERAEATVAEGETEAGSAEEAGRGADARSLRDLLAELRSELKSEWNRHVPTGTLLNDRETLARELGFGRGSTIYDESLVLGDVSVGENCWIGPYTVLDGSHAPLRISDWTSIGAGAQLYTHHTIDLALTGGKAPPSGGPVSVGRGCFVSPMSMIGPGTEIGDHSFVAAHSFVDGSFEPYSYIAGAPAGRVGRVEVRGARAILHRDQE